MATVQEFFILTEQDHKRVWDFHGNIPSCARLKCLQTPARAGSHHPLRGADPLHYPICNIFPISITKVRISISDRKWRYSHTSIAQCTPSLEGVVLWKQFQCSPTLNHNSAGEQRQKHHSMLWLKMCKEMAISLIAEVGWSTIAHQTEKLLKQLKWERALDWILTGFDNNINYSLWNDLYTAWYCEVCLLWRDQVHKYLLSSKSDPTLEDDHAD